MDIQQTVDLTYSKVDEINEKVNRVLTRTNTSLNLTSVENKLNENSTKLDEVDTNICSINENITEINTKLDSLEENVTEILSSNEEKTTKINEINTNVETIVTQTENLTTMNNNITTINSNTATTNNNVLTIKTDVQDLKTAMANTYFNNKIEQSLDRIINYINAQENKNAFQPDPYVLDLPYTEQLTTNRNPTNEDYYSIDEEFISKNNNAFFVGLIYCAGTTMNAKFTMSFTCSENITLSFMIGSKSYQTQEFEAGTHSHTLELTDVAVKNNKSVITFRNTGEIIVHNIQLELLGEQILYLNRQRKYHLSYSPGKIIVNKFENFKGYHLILDDIESLTPDMIEKPYTLAAEKVVSYGMNYMMYDIQGSKVPYGELRSRVNLSHTYNINYNDGYYVYASNLSSPVVYSNMGYYMVTQIREATIIIPANSGRSGSGSIITSYNSSAYGELSNGYDYAHNIIVADINRFDTTKRTYYILGDYAGYNYLQTKANTRFNVGFGKNVTAFLDTENEKIIRIYINDNGYCVRSIYLINEDNSDVELLSRKIIGTYDFYYETNSDVYFVVKNDELLMFKKTI